MTSAVPEIAPVLLAGYITAIQYRGIAHRPPRGTCALHPLDWAASPDPVGLSRRCRDRAQLSSHECSGIVVTYGCVQPGRPYAAIPGTLAASACGLDGLWESGAARLFTLAKFCSPSSLGQQLLPLAAILTALLAPLRVGSAAGGKKNMQHALVQLHTAGHAAQAPNWVLAHVPEVCAVAFELGWWCANAQHHPGWPKQLQGGVFAGPVPHWPPAASSQAGARLAAAVLPQRGGCCKRYLLHNSLCSRPGGPCGSGGRLRSTTAAA
jgi:hypothetical protein